MAEIAFILLCHKDPDAIIAQARGLVAAGDAVAIHFDARAPKKAWDKLRDALGDDPRVTFAKKRVKCGWGEWSLVAATLEAVKAAHAAFPSASHFYMVSGDCMAVKTAEYAHAFLDSEDVDFIESFDFFKSDWIRTGFKKERLIYRHFVNERAHKWLFYRLFEVQKSLGMERNIPDDLQMMIGSQWWCLRRATIDKVLDFCRERPDVMRFFSTTWIPDETFFQTIVRHVVPGTQIRSRTLTFLMFTDYGMPVTFHNDHYDLLSSQDALFARKISPEAQDLRTRLAALYGKTGVPFAITGEGRKLFEFVTQTGREGRRYAPRFWEVEGRLDPGQELLIITAKKWHVAKRLAAALRGQLDLPAVEYLFDEEAASLPDLGGIQTNLAKRHRHRRALMRLLFDYYGGGRLVICLDPSRLDMMRDFDSDRATVRVLEIDCDMDDTYLAGHARRVGLAGEATPESALAELLPMVRRDLTRESTALGEAGLGHHEVLRQSDPLAARAAALQYFLSITSEQAEELASMPDLFDD